MSIEAKLKPLEPYHNVGIFSFLFSFQFFPRLAAMFAEEVCDFGEIVTDGKI